MDDLIKCDYHDRVTPSLDDLKREIVEIDYKKAEDEILQKIDDLVECGHYSRITPSLDDLKGEIVKRDFKKAGGLWALILAKHLNTRPDPYVKMFDSPQDDDQKREIIYIKTMMDVVHFISDSMQNT